MSASDSKFSTSRGSRFLRLGAVSGKVGGSYLGHAVKGAFVGAESRAQALVQTNLRNAVRVARTFGELKGAVMKVGQMLSLQEDVLPPEMREVLRGLQAHAPPVDFSVLRPVLEQELGDAGLRRLEHISQQAYASASIGQVHRAKLDGEREVVLKIQYPGVERTVESDLRNIRMVTRSLQGVMPLKVDLGKFLVEVRARLSEELDYTGELANMRLFTKLLADDPRFVVPQPIEELSTRRVLTTEYEPGQTADEICAPQVPQSLRDRVGSALFELLYRQVYAFYALHADPNFANFAFRPNGRVVVYDFGCVKRLSPQFVTGLRRLTCDALARRYHRLPGDMEELGYAFLGRKPLPLELYRDFADVICRDVRQPGQYDFGASPMRAELLELKQRHWRELLQFDAPAEALFLGRTFGGMFGNLLKLRARVPVHDLLHKYLG